MGLNNKRNEDAKKTLKNYYKHKQERIQEKVLENFQ